MISKYYDKILLVSALLVLLVVFGFAAFRPDPQPITEFVDIPSLRSENTLQVSELPELDLSLAEWENPPAQSAGPEWVFDVFTPPVILFDTDAGEFVLPGVDLPPPQEFGIELVSIEDALYRVQLVGYFGREGSYLATLENVETGEQVLARQGQEYGNFGIEVRSIKIDRVKIDHGGETAVMDDVAFVVLKDRRLDQEVTLRSDQRKRDDEPTAVFRATDDSTQEFRARSGETFRHGDITYHVESLDPPGSAVITRTGGEDAEVEAEPDTKTLRVSRAADPTASGALQTPDVLHQGGATAPASTRR